MYTIRTTKTGSGRTAVQVVDRAHSHTKIIKHIGTAKDAYELHTLGKQAEAYIQEHAPQRSLLPELFAEKETPPLAADTVIDRLSFTRTYHLFAYEFLSAFYARIGFDQLRSPLLHDFAIIRVIEPASKRRSIDLLKKYFGKVYEQTAVYEFLPILKLLKADTEQIAVSYAQAYLNFNFSLVFYDVTTLYFETFTEDADSIDANGNSMPGLKKNGFGKERKPGQPQILIGLVVNTDGFPIHVEMFSGKTFEGHTILPVIKKLKQQYQIETLTIVADAAMLSLDNIQEIADAGLHYIVGARLGNIPVSLLKAIAEGLQKTEGSYYSDKTDRGLLICTYSEKRAAKDRSDRKKQLAKAQYQIEHPEQTKRRLRFVVEETKTTFKLNEDLLKQDTLREGIKGYYTNLTLGDTITAADIVARYTDLWHVEQSFRIAKSDLQARPIFHRKKDAIATHILIVFVSLCLVKAIELETQRSMATIKDMLWEIEDIAFTDTQTNKPYVKRMTTTGNPMAALLKKIQQENVDKKEKKGNSY